jgi:hypothetical protein
VGKCSKKIDTLIAAARQLGGHGKTLLVTTKGLLVTTGEL